MMTIAFLISGCLLLALILKNENKSLYFIKLGFVFIAIVFSSIGILNFIFNSTARSSALLGDRVFDMEILVGTLSFSLFVMVLFKTNKFYYNYSLIFLNIISLAYLFVLRTRAGWVSTGIVLIIMVWFLWRYYRKLIYTKVVVLRLGIVIVASFIVATFIPVNKDFDRPDLIKTSESIFSVNYYSNQARLSFWSASLKMFRNNPVTGIGNGKWAGLFPVYNGMAYTDENIDMNSAINPHNDYLEIITEFGIFGFLLFTGFIFTGIYLLFKKARDEIIYLPFLLSALGLCITMFFSFTKDNFGAMLIFTVCMGVAYSDIVVHLNKFKVIRNLLIMLCFLSLSFGIWFKVMNYLNKNDYLEAMQLKAKAKYSEMLDRLNNVSDFYYPVDMNKMPVDFYRGVGYFELKQYDKALEKFVNARKRMEYYPTVMNNEASALYMTGNYKEAEERYLVIKKTFPNYIEPQINLLSLYSNRKRNKEAKELIIELDNRITNSKYVKNYSVFLQIKDYFKEANN